MEYTHEILENGDHSIKVFEGDRTVCFIASPTSELTEHPLMIALFETTPESIHTFAQLLWDNPNTAFTEFVSTL